MPRKRKKVAPRLRHGPQMEAKCTPKIVYESVINSFNAGASGVIYSPNYNFMKYSNLDGSVKALNELKVL